MEEFMKKLSETVTVGVVGGSDFPKQQEQLGNDVADKYTYSFSENGLRGYKDGKLFHQASFVKHLGEEKMQTLINFILDYLSKVEIPVKRGTFVEWRNGMLNVSPIGRACSRDERNDFEKFDLEAGVRKTMVAKLEEKFGSETEYKLKFSIGGQISFDIFPIGWDKTYCLQFLESEGFDEIHFFGDKTYEGGNDHEIFVDKRTIGHTVQSWKNTKELCTQLFLS
eukprot:augustus_masked-scaffold_15-processed-gene-5.51-mRNA-1 protein AED:0.10 eAED:0.10 QI:0/-1/0/1/-1/1/1/0/223